MKLAIELVPEACWYKSLRGQMKRSQWDKLRKQVYADQDNRCAVCGADGRLNCHEIWEYDDARHVQRLIGFRAVCDLCHGVEHIGRTRTLAAEGHADLEAVIQHFMTVNGVNRRAFEQHELDADNTWDHRSLFDWTTDLGEWVGLIDPEPAG